MPAPAPGGGLLVTWTAWQRHLAVRADCLPLGHHARARLPRRAPGALSHARTTVAGGGCGAFPLPPSLGRLHRVVPSPGGQLLPASVQVAQSDCPLPEPIPACYGACISEHLVLSPAVCAAQCRAPNVPATPGLPIGVCKQLPPFLAVHVNEHATGPMHAAGVAADSGLDDGCVCASLWHGGAGAGRRHAAAPLFCERRATNLTARLLFGCRMAEVSPPILIACYLSLPSIWPQCYSYNEPPCHG